MTNIDLISFDDLVFHNVTNGIFQSSYYFPQNYTMIVKTEKDIGPQGQVVIYPNKYEVSLLHDNVPIIQNTIFKSKNQHFQTEMQITILMKQLLMWVLYGIESEKVAEEIKIEELQIS